MALLKLNIFQDLLCFFVAAFYNKAAFRIEKQLGEKMHWRKKLIAKTKASTPVKHRCMNLLLLHPTFHTFVLSPVLRYMRHGIKSYPFVPLQN